MTVEAVSASCGRLPPARQASGTATRLRLTCMNTVDLLWPLGRFIEVGELARQALASAGVPYAHRLGCRSRDKVVKTQL